MLSSLHANEILYIFADKWATGPYNHTCLFINQKNLREMRKLLVLVILTMMTMAANAKSKFSLLDNAAIAPSTTATMENQQRPQPRKRANVRQAQRRRAIASARRNAPPRYAHRGPAHRYHRPGPPPRYRRGPVRHYRHHPGPRPYRGPRRGYYRR